MRFSKVAWVTVAACTALLGSTAAAAALIDATYPAASVWDFVAGSTTDITDPAMQNTRPASGDNPHFMPDWNHNGVYGDATDVKLEHNASATDAKFRFPCINPDGTVLYRTTTGTCAADGTPGVQFRTGLIHKTWMVDSRGNRLAVRIMLPESVQQPGTSKAPGIVFSDGANFPASSFYAWDMNFVADGYMVMAYDESGQGDSEGTASPLGVPDPTSSCFLGWRSYCIDAQDAVRWFVGDSITPVVANPARNPATAPVGENAPNPYLSRLDTSLIGIIGQSAGSVATTSYTRYLANGKGMDGRPLPPVRAVVGMSGFGQASPVVPIQAQSADTDIPGVTADNFGLNVTDGPTGTHAWYESLRATKAGANPLEEILLESGSHGDTSNVTYVPHAVWSLALSTSYASNWMNCFVQGSADACAASYRPQPHLSRIYASEYDPDGPAGPSPSRCIAVPTQVGIGSVTDPLTALATVLGLHNYDCVK